MHHLQKANANHRQQAKLPQDGLRHGQDDGDWEPEDDEIRDDVDIGQSPPNIPWVAVSLLVSSMGELIVRFIDAGFSDDNLPLFEIESCAN